MGTGQGQQQDVCNMRKGQVKQQTLIMYSIVYNQKVDPVLEVVCCF
jgi:hypothetical protein